MTEHTQEEGIVPSSALDFLTERRCSRVGAYDIESEPSEYREILGSVVLSTSIAILVEDDIEHPMQLILDAPMRAHDTQQPFGGNVFGKKEVAHERRLGAAAFGASARSDAAQRNDPGKVVCGSEAGIAHNGGAPPLAPIVSGGVALLGNAAGSAATKQ